MATTYTLINSNVLTSSAASVTFSSIPATYTDLVLRMSVRTDNANTYDNLRIAFNSDSGSNYSRTQLTGDGSSGSSSNAANQTIMAYFYSATGDTATSNTFSNAELYIPNYNATANKPMSGFGVMETNSTTAYMTALAGLYRGGSGISSINIAKGGFATYLLSGSSFYLYGISNA